MRNSKKHTLKSFTLTEVIVVMIISTIVVGLAFSVLGIVQKNMNTIAVNYDHRSELASFEVALSLDFSKYTEIQWNKKEQILVFRSPIAEKQYHFETDSIYNDENTFLLKHKDILWYYEGSEVQTGNIDAIKIQFENTAPLYQMFVYKYNDPTIYF